MSANFEWNRQEAEERPAARRREAEEHRLALAATAGQARQQSRLLRLWRRLTRQKGGDSAESPLPPDHTAPPRPA